MSKIDLDPITSGYNLSKINANFQKVEDELNNKVLYRDSPAGEPNSMSSNLDMNSWSILNANKISSKVFELGGVRVVPTSLAVDPYNGTREALRRSYAEAGYNLVDGSFEAGGTLVNANDVILYESQGKAFTGQSGVVTPGTNPASPGFFDVSDSILRQQVLIKFTGSGSFSAVDNMIAGRVNGVAGAVAHRVGNIYSTGGTTWECLADGAASLDDFNHLTPVCIVDFGAIGDGVQSSLSAIQAALDYVKSNGGQVTVPAGRYVLDGNLELNGAVDIEITGESADSTLYFKNFADFIIKSPTNLVFSQLKFEGEPSDSVGLQHIWISNYKNIKFESCSFSGWGGATMPKQGATGIYLIAASTSSNEVSSGNSTDAKIIKCNFDGAGRSTSFAVRVYTPFDAVDTAKNTGALITECTFNEYNWNAVELAGKNTSSCIVSNCVANRCGLTPFDIDKGAHDNIVTDCVIDRLLGNANFAEYPNTALAAVVVQGRLPNADYAYNNIISNITVRLLKSDLDAFPNRKAFIGLAYAKDNRISNIMGYCDGVPIKSLKHGIGLAVITHETASGNVVSDVTTINASSGIHQTASNNGSMVYSNPNIFRNIENRGVMYGEIASMTYGASAGARLQSVYSGLNMVTDVSNPLEPLSIPSAFNFNVGAGSADFAIVEDSQLETKHASGFMFRANIPNFGMMNLELTGIPVGSRLISSQGSGLVNIGISNVNADFGRKPIDCNSIFNSVGSGVKIFGGITRSGLLKNTPVTLYSSSTSPAAAITTPSAIFVSNYITVDKIDALPGGFKGWVNASGNWRTYGPLSA